jgi:phosphoglycolate phosphatase
MPSIDLVCLDMAGTTVSDDGAVERAFTVAVASAGLTPGSAGHEHAIAVVRETMGQAKIEVFRRILGDEHEAQAANRRFEQAYADELDAGLIGALPGAADVLDWLRDRAVRVCLTTGFAPPTRDALLDHLGWGSRIDLALSPADVGRGRPWPDMVLAAAKQLGDVPLEAVAVVGDTPSDMQAGTAAGAALVIGVLTGAGRADELTDSGATDVLGSVAELPGLLEQTRR